MDTQLWQYHAAISAIAVLCMLAMSIHVQGNAILSKHMKRWLHVVALTVSICAIASEVGGYLDLHQQPPLIHETVSLLEFSLAPFISVFLCCAYGYMKSAKIAAAGLLAYVVFLLATSPFGLVFQILPDGTYVRGDFYFVQVIAITVSVLGAFFTAIAFGRDYHNRDYGTLAAIVAILATGTAVQIVNPSLKITYICMAVAMIFFYSHSINLLGQALVEEVNDHAEKLASAQQRMITGLAELIDVRDESTGQHIARTAGYVRILALRARESGYRADILTDEYIDIMVLCAHLHDVGKIAIPDAILNKPDRLTDEEFEIIKSHAERGGDIVENIMGDVVDPVYVTCGKEIAAYHHEKWDGSGYPEGLAGEDIPLCARIMAIADVYDALVARRVYKEGMPAETAFAIIEEGAGTHFDPELVRIFIRSRDEIVDASESLSPDLVALPAQSVPAPA